MNKPLVGICYNAHQRVAPNATTPNEIRPYQGIINHHSPLIRPAIRTLFRGGGGIGG